MPRGLRACLMPGNHMRHRARGAPSAVPVPQCIAPPQPQDPASERLLWAAGEGLSVPRSCKSLSAAS